MKKRVITLIDLRNKDFLRDVRNGTKCFEVKKLKNSVRFTIGETISKSEVETLNKDTKWEVNVIGEK